MDNEILLSCMPPYKEMNYFLDLARSCNSLDSASDRGRRVMILGTGIPEELIDEAGAVPYWILGGSRTLSSLADDFVPRNTDPVSHQEKLGNETGVRTLREWEKEMA